MSESTTTHMDICANCGKDNATNICNKCKMIKYCNAACKKKHRHKHKKDCEEHVRLAAERAAELHDEKLFKQPPQLEDCSICFLRMPSLKTGYKYNSCCGKRACSGCIYANATKLNDDDLCPFCRTVAPTTHKEMVERLEKRIKVNDAIALFGVGCLYDKGKYGVPQNMAKALELWHQAGELGCAIAYHNIGNEYFRGEGVQRDKKEAKHCWEQAAILGHVGARYNLGAEEGNAGNIDRALKHYMIAAGGGYSDSLTRIKDLLKAGYVSKDDYAKALRAHQAYLNEIKSIQRDEAAAYNEKYRYY